MRSERADECAVDAEELDAAGLIGHCDQVARRRKVNVAWFVKLASGEAILPEHVTEHAVGSENRDAVVVKVGYGDQVTQRRPCDRHRSVEMPLAGSLLAELDIKGAVGVEDLHAVVARVGHGDAGAVGRPGGG